VVDVTDVGTEGGVPYLVMELLEGETLAECIAREAPMPVAAVVDLLLPLCAALGALHEQGVIHRELKPANVFLARPTAGARGHPKLLDFGIAKLESAADTTRGALMGTPHYMAIEQWGRGAIDGRVDQYALGVIAYECVGARRPYEGTTTVEVFAAARLACLPALRDLAPSTPEAFEAVVLRALRREPDARFPGMRELGASLLPFADLKTRAQWGADVRCPDAPTALCGDIPRSSRGLSRLGNATHRRDRGRRRGPRERARAAGVRGFRRRRLLDRSRRARTRERRRSPISSFAMSRCPASTDTGCCGRIARIRALRARPSCSSRVAPSVPTCAQA
jgi:serine/threonine-protein kinase